MKSCVPAWRRAVLRSPLSTSAKLVALVIADHMNREGKSYPSQATIAHLASLRSERHVRRLVGECEAAGLLLVEHVNGKVSRYTAAFSAPATPDVDVRGESRDPGHGRPVPPGSTPDVDVRRSGESLSKGSLSVEPLEPFNGAGAERSAERPAPSNNPATSDVDERPAPSAAESAPAGPDSLKPLAEEVNDLGVRALVDRSFPPDQEVRMPDRPTEILGLQRPASTPGDRGLVIDGVPV